MTMAALHPEARARHAGAEPQAGAEFELEHGRERLVVGEIGARMRSWTVARHELLAGAPDDPVAGKVLAPWPGRLRAGRYRFDGAEHQTPLTEPERHNALHGLTSERRWRANRSRSGTRSRSAVRPTWTVLSYDTRARFNPSVW